MPKQLPAFALAALLIGQAAAADRSPPNDPAGVDPLTVELQSRDAQRFAVIFKAGDGKPSAAQLQAGYLGGAGRGVEIFIPGRIDDAARLAREVAKNSADYRHAIDTCLPMVDSLTAELRAIYLAYRGLLPQRPLPAVYLVFGAGNSGGTAQPDAQVLGLEVMCNVGTTRSAFRRKMRAIFAHETVHSWQSDNPEPLPRDLLLYVALREGTPDFLAGLVTGEAPSPEREAWARPQERALWAEFQRDRSLLLTRQSDDLDKQPDMDRAFLRWFSNYGQAPEGWPHEAGYWVGMQIAAAYVAKAADKVAAINDLITLKDAPAIFKASGYAPASP